MATALMTPEAFAQSIKAKYPDYASVPDGELAAKMLEKYPEYRDRVQAPPTPDFQTSNEKDASGRATVAPITSFLGRPINAQTAAALTEMAQRESDRTASGREVLKGVGKSALATIEGGGQIIRHAFGMKPSTQDPLAVPVPVDVRPANAEQRIGKAAGDIGQFFLPAGALSKVKLAMKAGVGVLDALVGAGLEGASAAGVSSAQKGTTEGAAKTGAIAAGTALGTQTALTVGAKGMDWLGQRIERALLKPTASAADGISPTELVKNVYKYDVGGTLGQSYDKVQAKIQTLVGNLRNVLQTSAQFGGGVSLNQVAQDVEQSFLRNPQAKAAVARILDHVEFGLNTQGIPAGTGVLNVADANVAKQAVGDMGAWLHDMHGNTVSDADKVTEAVANRFYAHLKTAIEQNATGPVASINKAISDLIPIRSAIIRRIPVADRANIFNMADIVGLSAHTLGLSIANRIFNSGAAANALVAGGRALPTVAGPAGAVAARGVAATRSETGQ